MEEQTQEKTQEQKPAIVNPLYRGTRIVWYIANVLEGLLAFRFFLKLLEANPSAGFTQLVYGITDPFMAPFAGVFRITRVEGVQIEWTALLAMMVYWLLAWAIVRIFFMSKPVSREEAARKLEQED